MRTSTKKDQPPAARYDDFCLADVLVDMSDEEIERMAGEHAATDVSSSAYEGIPLDEARLKAGLIESYKMLRAEWPVQRHARKRAV